MSLRGLQQLLPESSLCWMEYINLQYTALSCNTSHPLGDNQSIHTMPVAALNPIGAQQDLRACNSISLPTWVFCPLMVATAPIRNTGDSMIEKTNIAQLGHLVRILHKHINRFRFVSFKQPQSTQITVFVAQRAHSTTYPVWCHRYILLYVPRRPSAAVCVHISRMVPLYSRLTILSTDVARANCCIGDKFHCSCCCESLFAVFAKEVCSGNHLFTAGWICRGSVVELHRNLAGKRTQTARSHPLRLTLKKSRSLQRSLQNGGIQQALFQAFVH